MGERKGQNFYYPPDFLPKKHGTVNGYHGVHALRERSAECVCGSQFTDGSGLQSQEAGQGDPDHQVRDVEIFGEDELTLKREFRCLQAEQRNTAWSCQLNSEKEINQGTLNFIL